MGHYDDMMTEEEVKERELRGKDIAARIKAGYEVYYIGIMKDQYECPHCSALIVDWKNHEKFHKGLK